MFRKEKNIHTHISRGSTFIEVLIGTAIFVLVAVTAYESYTGLLLLVNRAKAKTVASALANEQFEIIRNLPYADVGIVSGIPAGKLQRFQTFVRSGITYQSTTTVRNIDDPFDGQIGSTTAPDLSSADYKVVEIEIGCITCKSFAPLIYTTNVAPKNLETLSTNGALFVNAIDANGLPVSGARVQIVNPSTTPVINIDEVTNASGQFQLVDAPPGANQYQITVSKSGYSTDQTYLPGAVANPNPLKPHATVALQQVTNVTFAIDKVSTLNFSTVRDTCASVPNINFTLNGTKLIGTTPDTLKYSTNQSTDGSGQKAFSDMEWDTYMATINSASYVLAGSIPNLPISLLPNSTQNVQLVLEPVNARQLLVTVKDSGTGLPVTDASVRLQIGAFDQTLSTNRGSLTQADWQGGDGQATSSDATKFFTSDGNIEYTLFPGEARLKEIFGVYQAAGNLTSSTFDLGGAANFYQILWSPGSQPLAVGSTSVQVQIASGNDQSTTTWNFKGPDGTSGTYYDSSNQNIWNGHNGDRYMRYKLFLSTASTTLTPSVTDVSLTFTSLCVPPGQVLFSGISSAGSSTLTVTKTGYQDYASNVNIGGSYQSFEVPLTP